MTRDELQDTAVFLLERNKRLICEWATGTGKSNVALKFIKNHPDVKTLILVPEQNNIDSWEKEFKSFKTSKDSVVISCYASYHKYGNTRWGLIVFDEVPHIDTELRLEISKTVKSEYILALGAKVTEDDEQVLIDCYGDFYKTKISLEQAVKWGILPKPMIIVCHMTLDDTKKIHWLNGKMYTARGMCEELDATISNLSDSLKDNQSPRTRQTMFRYGIQRKRFLGEMKQDAISRICESLNNKNKRYLCFCSSIKQANELGKAHAFTSKTPKSLKLLDKFNNREINSLFVVGKCIEGQNLVDIDCGIIGQLGGTERITIQSIGRIMRSESPVVYIPVFDGTKDDSFMYTLNANIPADYIKHYKFN